MYMGRAVLDALSFRCIRLLRSQLVHMMNIRSTLAVVLLAFAGVNAFAQATGANYSDMDQSQNIGVQFDELKKVHRMKWLLLSTGNSCVGILLQHHLRKELFLV